MITSEQINRLRRFYRAHNRFVPGWAARGPRWIGRQLEMRYYRRWVNRTEHPAPDLPSANADIVISVVIPVYRPPLEWFRRALDSVLAQTYHNWELCICLDGPQSEEVESYVRQLATDRPDQVRFTTLPQNMGISGATNAAISIASGSHIAFMDQDDLIHPTALAHAARILGRSEDVRLVYSDEDKIDRHGRRFEPHLKPDFDPVLLLTNNYICHLLVVEASLVEEVGGLRSRCDGAQDFDLMLRVTGRLRRDQIHHIPRVLYHWRVFPGSTAHSGNAKPYAHEAGRTAVADFLGERATAVHDGPVDFTYLPELRRTESARLPLTLAVLATPSTSDEGDVAAQLQAVDPDLNVCQVLCVQRETADFTAEEIAGALRRSTGEVVLLVDAGLRFADRRPISTMLDHLDIHGPALVGGRIRAASGRYRYPDALAALWRAASGSPSGDFESEDVGYGGRLQLPHAVEAASARFLLIPAHLQPDADADWLMGLTAVGVDLSLRMRRNGGLCIASMVTATETAPEWVPSRAQAQEMLRHLDPRHLEAIQTSGRFYPPLLATDTGNYSLRCPTDLVHHGSRTGSALQ